MTYAGSVLIAIYPFRKLTHLCDSGQRMETLEGATQSQLNRLAEAVAKAAYGERNQGRQSILVSGDIGAGETEYTKMLVQHLADLGGSEGRKVEQQIRKSNPILEAFGNVKAGNSNSRRFSKSVELQFDNDGRFSGAAVRTYLVELSRVCGFMDPSMSNYNCFYQLCATPKYIEEYKLKESFHYLNHINSYENDGVSDHNYEEYLATINAMQAVGIGSEEQDQIFQVLAAILHLGNVEFDKVEVEHSPKLKLKGGKDGKARFHLQTAAEFFKCDVKHLKDSLRKRVVCDATPYLDPDVAVAFRDSLAKTVYSRLFEWLVEKINKSIGLDKDRHQKNTLIRVIEINGYEILETNSIEQLFINFTNDMLGENFDRMEKHHSVREETGQNNIGSTHDDPNESSPVFEGIQLFIDGLDKCCPSITQTKKFTRAISLEWKGYNGRTKSFDGAKFSDSKFVYNHYGDQSVTYRNDLFIAKNQGYYVPQHIALLGQSTSRFLAGLFPPEDSSEPVKFCSVGFLFKDQVKSLVNTLKSTQVLYYITCVKPTDGNSLNQGVKESIRIRCTGHPTRLTFEEFIVLFGPLYSDKSDDEETSHDEETTVRGSLNNFGLVRGYKILEEGVHLSAGLMATLYAKTLEIINAAVLIQRKVRSHIVRRAFLRLRIAVIRLQSLRRAVRVRRIYRIMPIDVGAIGNDDSGSQADNTIERSSQEVGEPSEKRTKEEK